MKFLFDEIRHKPLPWLLAFVPILAIMVYMVFAMTLYLLPPRGT